MVDVDRELVEFFLAVLAIMIAGLAVAFLVVGLISR